jgi:prevent-host-death family protein
MSDIGVRELKIHASEIVHKVKEKGMRYVITHRGRPMAAIIPVEEVQMDTQSDDSVWDELVALGNQIGQGWQTKQSSTDILSDMRR